MYLWFPKNFGTFFFPSSPKTANLFPGFGWFRIVNLHLQFLSWRSPPKQKIKIKKITGEALNPWCTTTAYAKTCSTSVLPAQIFTQIFTFSLSMSIVHYVCYYLYTDAKKQSPGFVEVGQLRESLINSVVSWGGGLDGKSCLQNSFESKTRWFRTKLVLSISVFWKLTKNFTLSHCHLH